MKLCLFSAVSVHSVQPTCTLEHMTLVGTQLSKLYPRLETEPECVETSDAASVPGNGETLVCITVRLMGC